MTELFEDEEDVKALVDDDEIVPVEETVPLDARQRPSIDARRRLESLLDEKRLREELDDLF